MIVIPEVEEFRKSLANGGTARAVYIAGGDDGVRDGVVEVMIADGRAKEGIVTVLRLDAPPTKPETSKQSEGDSANTKQTIWDEIRLLAVEVPMFGGATVVVVSGCGSGSVKLSEPVKNVISEPPAHLRVVMFADRKTTKSALAKLVAVNGRLIDAKDVNDSQAMTAVVSAGRQVGLMVDGRVAAAIVDLVGSDRSAIESAVRVLAEYAGPDGRIGLADLPGLVQRTRKSAPWDLDDAIGNRNLALATKLAIRDLEDSKDPRGRAIGMFNGIVRQARKMFSAKAMLARGEDRKAAMEKLQIGWDFMWDRLIRSTQQYSREELEAFLIKAPALEIRIKRGHGGPTTQILDVLMSLMVQRPGTARR